MRNARLAVLALALCSVSISQRVVASSQLAAPIAPVLASTTPALLTQAIYAQTSPATINALDAVIEGRTLAARGRWNEAIAAYRRAIAIDPTLAVAYNNLGIALAEQGRLQEAEDAYRTAIRLDSNLANAYNNLATVLEELGRPDEAEQIRNQASDILSSTNTANVIDYINLGRALANQGKHEEAIAAYQISLEINPNLGVSYNNIGNSLRSLERLEEAAQAYRRAIELSPNLVVAYNNLGFVLTRLNRPDEAREIYDQANEIDPRLIALRDPDSAAAEDYNTLGRVLRSQNRREEAIAAYSRAIELDSKFAAAYNNRGVAYAETGRLDEAIEDYRVASSLDPTPTQYVNLGNTLRAAGRTDEAINAYLNIRSIFELIERLPARVDNQNLLAALVSDQNNFEFYRDRASFFAENQSYYASYINILMQLHQERPASEMRFDALALETSERARARSLLEILTEAEAYQRVGDPQIVEQEHRLRRQFERLQTRWNDLSVEQQTIDAQRQLSGDTATDSALSDPAQALQIQSELSARQDQLQTEKTSIEQQINQLLEQYKAVQEQIRASNPDYAEITQPKSLTVQDIQNQILDDDTLLLEYWLGEEHSYLWLVSKTGITTHRLPGRATIDRAARRFYDYLTVPSQRVKPIQTAQAGMELSRMILEPVADQLEGKRLLVVADGALHYVPFSAIPIPQPESVAIDPQDLPKPLIVEHEIVNLPSASALAIIRERLGDRDRAPKTLAVIADPVFNHEDPRFVSLAEGALASPSSRPRTESNSQINTLSRLTGTSQEASEIIEIADDEGDDFLSLIGFDANRDRVFNDELSQYQILHFATHGFLNDRNPAESGLVLSQYEYDEQLRLREGDDFLSLTDIFDLYLPAELVVLSGCRTGLGANLRGEGLVGLTRGFMYAGAKRVLVSLWSVDDEATAALMSRFYNELIDKGNSPAEALRDAQIDMINDPTWQTPYYWAAFTLQGEWR